MRVVGREGDARPSLRRRIHAVRVGHAPAGAQRVEARVQRRAAGQRQHGIHALRRELARRGGDVAAAAVDGHVGAEPAHQRDALVARSRRQHARAAHLGDLQRQRAHRATRAMDDQRLAAPDVQHAVRYRSAP
jgi:hypothetical protein